MSPLLPSNCRIWISRPWTNRGAPRRRYKRLFAGIMVGDLRLRPRLYPQHDLIAPGITKGVVIAVELLPIMILPQQGGTALHSGIEDGLMGLAIADQNPNARFAPAICQAARFNA